MSKCANCETDATIAYVGAGRPISYCNKHLPSFLRRPEYKYKLAAPKDVTPVVEPVVEAPVVEPVVESPIPKASKKKTTSEAPAEETPAPVEEEPNP